MNQQSQKDSNQNGNFNLLHEQLRGAMYRGGKDRDTVFTGYVLGAIAMVVCLVVSYAVLLLSEGLGFDSTNGELIAWLGKECPLLFYALCAVIGAISFGSVLWWAEKKGIIDSDW